MSYPKQLHKFREWAKAMERNATVDKPDYGKTRSGSKAMHRRRPSRRRRRRWRLTARKRRNNGD